MTSKKPRWVRRWKKASWCYQLQVKVIFPLSSVTVVSSVCSVSIRSPRAEGVMETENFDSGFRDGANEIGGGGSFGSDCASALILAAASASISASSKFPRGARSPEGATGLMLGVMDLPVMFSRSLMARID